MLLYLGNVTLPNNFFKNEMVYVAYQVIDN